MKDEAYLAESEKLLLPVNPVSGPEAARIVDKMMSVSPE